jgi:hypothetical protein
MTFIESIAVNPGTDLGNSVTLDSNLTVEYDKMGFCPVKALGVRNFFFADYGFIHNKEGL